MTMSRQGEFVRQRFDAGRDVAKLGVVNRGLRAQALDDGRQLG